MEFRSEQRGKRVIIDILQDGRWLSRNPVSLRAIGGGRRGYRFATLLAMTVSAGEKTYEIKAQGADLVVIVTERKTFHKEFAIRSFEDTRASEALVAAPEPVKGPEEGKGPVEGKGPSEQAPPESEPGAENATLPESSAEDTAIFGGGGEGPAVAAADAAMAQVAGLTVTDDSASVRLALSSISCGSSSAWRGWCS